MVEGAQSVALELPFALEMLGVIVGGMGGALNACERKLDIVGAVALSMVCGLGGGLIRDTIMQSGSVYMLDSPYAIPVTVTVGLVVFFFRSPFERHPNAIEWLDILSVALFAVAGTDKALVYGLSPLAVLLMGVLTGNGGGLLRDIVLGDVPKLFQRANWYGICSLGGSTAYYLLVVMAEAEKGTAGIIAVLVTVAMRRLSLRYDLKSPADVDLTPKVAASIENMRKLQRRTSTTKRSKKHRNNH